MKSTNNHYAFAPSANPERKNLNKPFLNRPRQSSWSSIFSIIFFTALVLFASNQLVAAQTFNDALNAQLARDPATNLGCARLVGGTPRDGSGEPIGFGPELADICGPVIGGGSGTSGGTTGGSGGAAVVQVAQERRKELREEERTAAPRYSVYVTAPNYEKIDRDTTEFEVGYDSDVVGGTVGADVLIKNTWVVGMAFDYKRWEGDYDSGGDFDTDVYRPIIYASFFPMTGLFADVFLSYAWNDVSDDRVRLYTNEADDTFSGNISSKPDTEEFKVGVSLGYDHTFRQFNLGPRLAIDYLSADFDSFREKGTSGLELEYDKDSRVSFQSKLGLQASLPISTSFGWLYRKSGATGFTSIRTISALSASGLCRTCAPTRRRSHFKPISRTVISLKSVPVSSSPCREASRFSAIIARYKDTILLTAILQRAASESNFDIHAKAGNLNRDHEGESYEFGET